MKPMIDGMIMAGGRSSRMGEDKSLLEVNGQLLMHYCMDRIKAQTRSLMLNLSGNQPHAPFEQFQLPIYEDCIKGRLGPLVGILTALKAIQEKKGEWVLVVPCDCPFLPENLVTRLYEAAIETNSKVAIAASNQRQHPVVGLWHVTLLEPLEHAIIKEEYRKIDKFTSAQPHIIVEFPQHENAPDPFLNLNRPEDIKAAQKFLKNNL